MADPRSTATRRAVLSYDQLKQLTEESGAEWPNLLIKDYQGIIQDFVFTSNELDAIDARVTINEAAIASLNIRVDVLEFKSTKVINTIVDMTTDGYQTIICRNTGPITITLELSPVDDTEVNIKRRGEEVTVVGLINGTDDRVINIPQWSMKLVYDGTDWSTI
jgi:hypothetical protein